MGRLIGKYVVLLRYIYTRCRDEINMSCGHLSENMTDEIVKARGLSILQKFKKLALLVKTGKLSIYDLVAELDITYIEAFSLLLENGYLS